MLPVLVLLGGLFFSGCATFYEKNIVFQETYVKGDMEKANQILDKNKKAAKDKDKLLYFLQKGVVLQTLGNYAESNAFFEKAYIFTEDYRKSYTKEAASLLTNPTVKPYTGEDHELVLMHYFKAINYLKLKQYDEALVECRRIKRFKRDSEVEESLGLGLSIVKRICEQSDLEVDYRFEESVHQLTVSR